MAEKKKRTRRKPSYTSKKVERYEKTIPKSTLTPRGKRKSTFAITAQHDLWCINYKLCGVASRAAAMAGFAPSYGNALKNNAVVRQRLAKIDDSMLQEAIKESARKLVMTVDFLDDQFMYRLINMQTHEKVGDIALAKMFEVGYKRTGHIQAAKVTATALAGANATAGDTMEAVYKSKWLKKKETSLAEQFEEEFQSPPKQLVDSAPPSE